MGPPIMVTAKRRVNTTVQILQSIFLDFVSAGEVFFCMLISCLSGDYCGRVSSGASRMR